MVSQYALVARKRRGVPARSMAYSAVGLGIEGICRPPPGLATRRTGISRVRERFHRGGRGRRHPLVYQGATMKTLGMGVLGASLVSGAAARWVGGRAVVTVENLPEYFV